MSNHHICVMLFLDHVMVFTDHVMTSSLFIFGVSISSTRVLHLDIDVSILKYTCPGKWIQNLYKWIHIDT